MFSFFLFFFFLLHFHTEISARDSGPLFRTYAILTLTLNLNLNPNPNPNNGPSE